MLALAVLSFVPVINPASACTSSNGRSAPYATVRLVLNNPSGMPAAVQQGITGGIAAWNSSSCNDGDDYPAFFTSGTADVAIQVFFDPNISQVRDQNNNTLCASINHGGVNDGSNATITLHGSIRLADGRTFECYPNSSIAADSVAHELGHYLGLADSGCSDHIMAERTGTVTNGQMTWSTSRQVQAAECTFADSANSTTLEQNNETSDPFCEAYCWTSCVNNVCPDGNPGCPILMDLENDGIHLTGLDPVWFDIDADGGLDLISWTDRGEGLLALDRNRNGLIDDGSELFGDATRLSDGSRALNGYLALAELDTWVFGGNEDGHIDVTDAAFGSLQMWIDRSHDGVSQPEELQTLQQAGILRIGLGYRRSNRTDRHGNELRFLGRAWKVDRHEVVRPILTWDVFFLVRP
jgi:hypothetical protein